jgi:hypothetical protein
VSPDYLPSKRRLEDVPSTLIRYGAILLIFILWVIATSWAVSSVLRIHRVGSVDTDVAVRLVRKALFKNPFAVFSELVRERADLALSLTALEGITLTPAGGEVISAEYMQDRRQYLLTVWNPSKAPFYGINLRIQFPYPVETYQVSVQREADDVTFRAAPLVTMRVFGGGQTRIPVQREADDVTSRAAPLITMGGGQIRVGRRPLTRDCELQIAQLRPEGRIEILLILNSWRDHRGEATPPHDGLPHFVPESGPEITYIYGSFSFTTAGETIERNYYAPLILNDDKTVTLGPPGPLPEHLVEETGIE